MVISFNQPAFIPWGGFFARLMSSDSMVLLDDTVLARGFTFVNRNRLKGPEGEIWITVPLKRKGRGAQKIKNLEIYEKERWKKKLLATLKHYYGHSAYFSPVIEEIRSAVDEPGPCFLNLAITLLNILRANFGIDVEMNLQSDLKIVGKGTSLLVSIASELRADEVILPHGSEKAVERALLERAGIKVRFLRYAPPQYPQFWGNFLLNLSALDLLLCCGPGGRAVIEKGIHFHESTA
ncbi:MAG: WbqC family protein [Candidatus Aminicenantales bacterium]